MAAGDITFDAEGPGAGGVRPVLMQSPRVYKFVSGQLETSGDPGDDISGIFEMFRELKGILSDIPLDLDYDAQTAATDDPATVRFVAYGVH